MPNNFAQEIVDLGKKISEASLPPKLAEETLVRLNQLTRLSDSPHFLPEFDRLRAYIDWITILPWQSRTQDNLDLSHATSVLESVPQFFVLWVWLELVKPQ